MNNNIKIATFGGGCFWCVAAIFDQLRGVEKVTTGYTHSQTQQATEIVQLLFAPNKISYRVLVQVHLNTHNPFFCLPPINSMATKYKSLILHHNAEQQQQAQQEIAKFGNIEQKKPLTVIQAFQQFIPAIAKHQSYHVRNKTKPYYQCHIQPKIAQLNIHYQELLKS